MQSKVLLQFVLALAAAGAIAATALAGPRGEAGECGEYRYWHARQCTDARNKQNEKSWSEEILAKHWKP
jgi:hypothetical protein